MRKYVRYLIVFLLGVTTGSSCTLIFHEAQKQVRYTFENLEEIEPPAYYIVWFKEVAECSGLSASADTLPFDNIKWRLADEIYDNIDNTTAVGLFQGPNTITLHRWNYQARQTPKHEMLHYLLQPTTGHPSPPFGVCNK